jgi:hypothetical protein
MNSSFADGGRDGPIGRALQRGTFAEKAVLSGYARATTRLAAWFIARDVVHRTKGD